MESSGVVITAGFDKSQSAVAVAELLKRKGIAVKGFIVVSPYSWSRFRKYIQKRGLSFVWEAIPRLLGLNKHRTDGPKDYLDAFFEEKNIRFSSIKKWAKENKANYYSAGSINDQGIVGYLKEMNPRWLVYSGGGIIKDPIITAMEGRILNAHQGPLPEVRGMNAAEWSILLDEPKEVTIHLIDKGIDTGKIITSLPYSVDEDDTIDTIRDKAKVQGIRGLVEVAAKKNLDEYELRDNNSDYRQCYILSSTMRKLLLKKLQYIQKAQ
ncbi:MAG: formyltransferase family protein [Balneolaceae bacterium]|nr:formyltransferase family protein [Balneolaceae bacterium]